MEELKKEIEELNRQIEEWKEMYDEKADEVEELKGCIDDALYYLNKI